MSLSARHSLSASYRSARASALDSLTRFWTVFANAEWKRLGGRGVPLFVINRDVSSGFSEGGMARRLARYGW